MKKHLQVMKFGGTSVGDAKCISRVAEFQNPKGRASMRGEVDTFNPILLERARMRNK